MTTQQQHIDAAHALGVEHAKNAASWILEGNAPIDYHALLALIVDGDPRVDDYLPRRPNLSGEYAGDLTPLSLAREIVGGLRLEELADTSEALEAEFIEVLADAYEAGVDETFEAECERLLREATA